MVRMQDHRGSGVGLHHAGRVWLMTSHDLDVVVLGCGGHVGRTLSPTLADAGLCVGVYDTNEATLGRIANGAMPFLENGADELLRRVLESGRLELGSSGDIVKRTNQLIVVVGTPVDEF